MRSSLASLVRVLWTLWFALITVGPGGFGACPEHGAGGHDHMATPIASSGALAAPAADPHAGHHGQHTSDTEEAAPSTDLPAPAHHQCTCLGACCMMAPSALPAATEMLVASVSTRVESPTPAYRSVLAARRVFSQPYAIGPPAAPIA